MNLRSHVCINRCIRRRGSISILAAAMLIILVAVAALAIDVGYMAVVRTEAQRTADAAALAGAWEMIGEDRLRGDLTTTYTKARQTAAQFAGLNKAGSVNPVLNLNFDNANLDSDIVLGRLDNPTNRNEAVSFNDASQFNTMVVRVRCTAQRNQQAPLFFARALGFDAFETEAMAIATFDDNVIGFRVADNMPNSSLLPFTVKRTDLEALMAGSGTDSFSFDPETGNVVSSSDGIREMKMFPESAGNGQNSITPGNWGTVDIGNANNSTSELGRQIRDGVTAEDLGPYDGTLALDKQTGTVTLNGDTGLSVGMKDALDAVVGQPRTIPLYTEATGQGNTTTFKIDGFVGVKIVKYNLTGDDKYILIQPAYVFDPTAVTAPNVGSSYFVGQPVHLTR